MSTPSTATQPNKYLYYRLFREDGATIVDFERSEGSGGNKVETDLAKAVEAKIDEGGAPLSKRNLASTYKDIDTRVSSSNPGWRVEGVKTESSVSDFRMLLNEMKDTDRGIVVLGEKRKSATSDFGSGTHTGVKFWSGGRPEQSSDPDAQDGGLSLPAAASNIQASYESKLGSRSLSGRLTRTAPSTASLARQAAKEALKNERSIRLSSVCHTTLEDLDCLESVSDWQTRQSGQPSGGEGAIPSEE